MSGEQGVSESLLAGAGDAWPQLIGVGNGCWIYEVNARQIGDGHGCQHVRNRVQRLEALVDRDFKDGGRRVD